jgi:hypothetical protein
MIRLVRREAAKNLARFYLIQVVPGLFENWGVMREWGRLGKQEAAGRIGSMMMMKPTRLLMNSWKTSLNRGIVMQKGHLALYDNSILILGAMKTHLSVKIPRPLHPPFHFGLNRSR